MGMLRRVVNALRGGEVPRPVEGRVVVPRAEDSVREYPSAGLTPSGLASILREADAGSLSSAMALFEQMEEKDAHLFSVANTRRLALTGLEWEIVSAADVTPGADRAAADNAADYCRELLAGVEGFDEALQHLSLALGRNVSVAEIVWEARGSSAEPVALCPVDFARLTFGELDELRILTENEPMGGEKLPPHKFVVHTPHATSGHPQRGGLLRVTSMVYLAKNLALKDWMIFAEVFGMPVRIARYEPTATKEEKQELLRMLDSLGSNAAGIFSRAVELQVLEANRGTQGPPFEKLIDFLNREMSKAWLGQTLTTEVSSRGGTLAASRVHDEVRRDILQDDVRKEGRTIRRDLLAPAVRLRFGPDAPVPFFRRRPNRLDSAGELADVLRSAVNDLGLRVSEGWAHEAMGLPRAAGGERAVAGAS